MMMTGGSFEGADGYMNLQGFLQLPGSEGANLHSLQAATADQRNSPNLVATPNNTGASGAPPSRYESQKRRDWNTFGQYLRNHRPPLALAKCSGAHVLEFLRYLDQFGKTKVHTQGCPFFGQPQPPSACPCPLRQAWGSLDALIGRLRAAFEENGGKPESNPFGARAVRLYLRDVRETQAKARGIAYEKKKRKRPPQASAAPGASSTTDDHHHQASLSTAAACTVASSSLLSSHAESVYSSSIAQMGMNHHDNTGAGGLLHQHNSLGIPPNHSYHHHHLPQAPTGPSPPPLIPSFN